MGDTAGFDVSESSVGLTIIMLVAVDTTPSDPVTVRVTLPLVETGFVVFVPFGNEWVGINVGNEVMSIDGADVVEFANDCAATSAGKRAERILNEYCMMFDLFRFLIIVKVIVKVIVKIWKQMTDRSVLKVKEI